MVSAVILALQMLGNIGKSRLGILSGASQVGTLSEFIMSLPSW